MERPNDNGSLVVDTSPGAFDIVMNDEFDRLDKDLYSGGIDFFTLENHLVSPYSENPETTDASNKLVTPAGNLSTHVASTTLSTNASLSEVEHVPDDCEY